MVEAVCLAAPFLEPDFAVEDFAVVDFAVEDFPVEVLAVEDFLAEDFFLEEVLDARFLEEAGVEVVPASPKAIRAADKARDRTMAKARNAPVYQPRAGIDTSPRSFKPLKARP